MQDACLSAVSNRPSMSPDDVSLLLAEYRQKQRELGERKRIENTHRNAELQAKLKDRKKNTAEKEEEVWI